MRTSLTDIQQTEKYLEGTLSPADRFVFETRLLASPMLRMNLLFQKKAYYLVRLYHRKKIKEKIESAGHKLFSDPDKLEFQKTVYRIFER